MHIINAAPKLTFLPYVVNADLKANIKGCIEKIASEYTKGLLLSIALRILEIGLHLLVVRVLELGAIVLLLCWRSWGRSSCESIYLVSEMEREEEDHIDQEAHMDDFHCTTNVSRVNLITGKGDTDGVGGGTCRPGYPLCD
jgi:hypothetical protein